MYKVLPINELKAPSNISRLCNEVNQSIIITKNGCNDMFIMSVKVYEELSIKLQVANKINESLKDIPAVKSELFFSKMKKKYRE